MRLRPLEELEGVGQYVDYRAETLDRAAGAAWKIEDERPAAGARERPREPAERIDPTHRLGESGGLSVEDRSVASGVRSRGENPVPPVVTRSPAKPSLISRRAPATDSTPSATTLRSSMMKPLAPSDASSCGPLRSSLRPLATVSETTRIRAFIDTVSKHRVRHPS